METIPAEGFRVGIVGCGGIAQVHAAVLAALPDVQLTACADIRPERAAAMAAKTGCRAFSSLEEMLDAGPLDAIHLCTPHHLHAAMAVAAAERGIPVFTEKPPAIDREQWAMICRAAEKVPLGICFQNRYCMNIREAERLIASGEYGSLTGARAFVTWQRGERYYRDSGWRGAWGTEGGGVLINQAVHTLDLLIRFMGPAERVEAHMANRHLQGVIEVEDTLEAFMTMQGRPVLLYATNAYAGDAPVIIELRLEKATLRLESDTLEIITGKDRELRRFATPEPLGKDYWGNGHLPCIQDFYRSLAEKHPFQNDVRSVEATMDALLRIYEQGRKDLA